MPAPSVSVVIPTFNRPAATQRALQSVFDQTVSPLEIIVVDDGSDEPFVANGRDDVRVIRLPANRGAAAARQAGIDVARGALVAFLDSDDLWTATKLETQLAAWTRLAAADDSLTAVACGWESVSDTAGTSRFLVPVESSDVLDFASGCWFCPGSTVLVPRAAFEKVGPFDASLRRLEDLDWFLRFALRGGRLAVAPFIGAAISTGRRGRPDTIDAAGRAILGKLDLIEDANLRRQVRKRLDAYLDIERANAALGSGQYLATGGYCIRSLLKRPRLSIPLKRWWTSPEKSRA